MSAPSELLTLYRRAGPLALKRARALPRRPQPARAITYTAVRGDIGSAKKHATDKPDRMDVQSDASGSAQDAKAKGGEGGAVGQKDESGGKKMWKKEFPESPDKNAGVGFQDERGAKPSSK